MLLVFVLILELAAQNRTSQRAQNAVPARLVASKVTGRTSRHGAHHAAVAFCLCVGVCGAVVLLAAGLSIGLSWILSLAMLGVDRVSVVLVGTLLRELLCRRCAGVLLLIVLSVMFRQLLS
jgi:hypothetical protein